MLVNTAYTGVGLTLRFIAGFLLAILLTFLLVYDGDRLWRRLTSALPAPLGPRLAAAGTSGWQAPSGYMRGTLVIATFHGIVIGLTLAILGVPLAPVPAGLVFLGSFIPIGGALIAVPLSAVVQRMTPQLLHGGPPAPQPPDRKTATWALTPVPGDETRADTSPG